MSVRRGSYWCSASTRSGVPGAWRTRAVDSTLLEPGVVGGGEALEVGEVGGPIARKDVVRVDPRPSHCGHVALGSHGCRGRGQGPQQGRRGGTTQHKIGLVTGDRKLEFWQYLESCWNAGPHSSLLVSVCPRLVWGFAYLCP